MAMNLAVPVLVTLGALITILGLFAGGSIELIVVGLVAVAVGGVLGVLGQRRGG